jgi:hypothetical protein
MLLGQGCFGGCPMSVPEHYASNVIDRLCSVVTMEHAERRDEKHELKPELQEQSSHDESVTAAETQRYCARFED